MSLSHHTFQAVIVGVLVAPLVGSGCRQETAPQAQPVSTHASPEESFAQIVTALKEGLELPGSRSGFVSSDSGASARFQVHNTVTSILIPPANADDPYRGEITVSTQSVYSLRKSAEHKEDNDNKSFGNQDRGSTLFDESAESGPGFSSVDESLVSEAPDADKPGDAEIDSVQRRADHVDRKYELRYKGDRWELVTKLDPETESAIKNAFDRALRLQP